MKNREKKSKALLWAFIFVIGLLFSPKFLTHAATEKVKVGYFNMSGYQEVMQDGSRWGYGYDYLQEVSKYTNWEYEYVDGSWDECLERLEKGEVDIVTCAKWTSEREEKFDFSDYRIGIQYSLLTVRVDDERYLYDDYENFDDMVVGMMKSNRCNEELEELAKRYQIYLGYEIFETEKEMTQALQEGRVDAIVSSNQRIIEQEKVIAKFELEPFFAIVREGDKKRLDQLNEALFKTIVKEPHFESKLYKKYFENNTGYKIALSKEEKDYIEKNPVLYLVASPNATPKTYYEDGKYTGIVIDCIQKMAEEVGMTIKYMQTDSYTQAIDYVKQGKADAIGDFYADYSWGARNGFLLTEPYLDVKYVAVTRKNGIIAGENIEIATCENFFFNNIYIYKNYNKENITFYQTEEESMNAVKRGVADIAFVNQYTSKVLLERDDNLMLTGNTMYGSDYGLAIAVKEEDRMLAHILNKAISNLEDDTIAKIIEGHTVKQTFKVSLSSYIYYNFFEFVVIFAIIFAIIILILFYLMHQKRNYNKRIEKLAYNDRMTGILNIYRFEELGEKKRSEYKLKNYFVLSLDISHFAIINESYGRVVGDMVIRYVATNLEGLVGEKGLVARNKADNFIVMKSFIHQKEIYEFVESIREVINTYEYMGHEIKLNYHCGFVEVINSSRISVKKAVDRAELARKIAKTERFQTQAFNQMMEKQLHRQKIIEDSFEKALEKEEFLVYYQPKVHMKDKKIVGAEALVRWVSEDNGFMSPDEFIPILESNGAIIELDFYVLERVLEFLHTQIKAGNKVVPISVNQSRMHFMQENYIERLNKLREIYEVPHELIELELTESIFANIEDIKRVVSELKENGYLLSVDDFGAGYSSLNMLKEIPLDTLKIDKDFLNDVADKERYQKVVTKVVELAKDLEMNIICEGVELEEQAVFLQSVGCMYAQGFLYARPMPEEEFLKKLEEI